MFSRWICLKTATFQILWWSCITCQKNSNLSVIVASSYYYLSSSSLSIIFHVFADIYQTACDSKTKFRLFLNEKSEILIAIDSQQINFNCFIFWLFFFFCSSSRPWCNRFLYFRWVLISSVNKLFPCSNIDSNQINKKTEKLIEKSNKKCHNALTFYLIQIVKLYCRYEFTVCLVKPKGTKGAPIWICSSLFLIL